MFCCIHAGNALSGWYSYRPAAASSFVVTSWLSTAKQFAAPTEIQASCLWVQACCIASVPEWRGSPERLDPNSKCAGTCKPHVSFRQGASGEGTQARHCTMCSATGSAHFKLAIRNRLTKVVLRALKDQQLTSGGMGIDKGPSSANGMHTLQLLSNAFVDGACC